MAQRPISELKAKLQRLVSDINLVVADSARVMATDAKTLAYRNITRRGLKGHKYSINKYSAWFLEGKELNAAGRRYVKTAKKKREGVNWRGLREAQGLPGRFIDLQYTGTMWRGMGVTEVRQTGQYRYVAFLGGTSTKARDEMGWNYARYGDFINDNLNKPDIDFLNRIVIKRIDSAIKKLDI